jgi:hypothetical protein
MEAEMKKAYQRPSLNKADASIQVSAGSTITVKDQ